MPTYSLSGTITSAISGASVQNVAIKLSGIATASTSTDANGRYSFTKLANGSYTVTASLANAEFNPANLSVTISGSDAAGENFLSIEGAMTASGITFLPASFSSSDQLRASLLVSGGKGIFFTDSSNQPLKKVAVGGGATTTLADRFGAAENVVLHGGNVFWVDGGQLNETSFAGTTTVLASGSRDPGAGVTADIVVDGTNAYWVNTVSSNSCSPSCTWIIVKIPLGGGPPVTLATVQRKVVGLASDTNNIYWEEAMEEPVSPGCLCGSEIKSIPKSGGGSPVVLVDALLNGPPPALGPGDIPILAADRRVCRTATQVVFGVAGSPSLQAERRAARRRKRHDARERTGRGIRAKCHRKHPGRWHERLLIDAANLSINSVPLAGGTIKALVSGIGAPVALAIDAANAYWTDTGAYLGCCLQSGAGSLKQAPLIGGAVSTVISGLDAPGRFDVDGANFAWTEVWRVAQAPLAGTPVTTIASGISSNLARIAVDQTNVYILDGDMIKTVPLGGGTIEKRWRAAVPSAT